MNKSEALLNIKQAAEILNVSEISLRRWSNAGKLPCLRVGVRRERRFRPADLLSYLERNQMQENTERISGALEHVACIELEGMSINYGSHLCAFYETDEGCLKLALPFILGGLEKNDRCFIVATPEVQDKILHALRDIQPCVDRDVEEGNLVVIDRLSDGLELYAFFEQAFLHAVKKGIKGMRVLGDMAWALQKGMDVSDINTFEARYNNGLGHQFPVVSLCQYDARLFSSSAVLSALKCHDDTFRYPLAHFLGV